MIEGRTVDVALVREKFAQLRAAHADFCTRSLPRLVDLRDGERRDLGACSLAGGASIEGTCTIAGRPAAR